MVDDTAVSFCEVVSPSTCILIRFAGREEFFVNLIRVNLIRYVGRLSRRQLRQRGLEIIQCHSQPRFPSAPNV